MVACTLADGDYLLGAGVLVNSLISCGFEGLIFIGYRGDLPPWAGGKTSIELNDHSSLEFLLIKSDRMLNFEKPSFMLGIAERLPDMTGIVFFDADIVVTTPWVFFKDWLNQGVGLCQDSSYPWISPLHPWRLRWTETARRLNRTTRPLDAYFNGGFILVPKQHLDVVKAWKETIDHVWPVDPTATSSAIALTVGHRSGAFYATCQDALSVAAMASDVPLSFVGSDAMGFAPGAFIMLHAIGGKPWRQRYIRAALSGVRPGAVDKTFWQHADAPLQVFSAARQRWTRVAILIASAIGRFYHRS